MNKLILLSLLFTVSSWASNHSSCSKFTSGSVEVLKVTKTWNRANELRFAVSVDRNCQFVQQNPVKVYWVMGKKRTSRGTPCEAPLLKEVRDMIGYNDLSDMKRRMVSNVQSNRLTMSLPGLQSLIRRTGSRTNINQSIEVTVSKVNGKCRAQATALVNSREMKINRVHSIIKFLSLKSIELYQGTKKLMVIK